MSKFLNITELFRMSFDALKKNRVRTILSIVGIVIGISTLVIVLGISNAAEGFIRDQLASFGADTVFVEVKIPNADRATSGAAQGAGVQVKTMKIADVVGARKIPNVKDSYGAAIGQEKVIYRENTMRTFVYGTTASYPKIDSTKIDEGRFYSEAEDNAMAKVAVLGPEAKEKLFGNEDPLGKYIRIRSVTFKVIGVTQKRGAALGFNYDELIYLPLKTQQKLLLGYDYLPYFVVQVDNPDSMDVVAEDLRRFLRKQHGIQGNDPQKDDFSVETSQDSMETINVVFGAVSLLFGAIASISLLVGGVGIMNIMYVSVTERVREIGLRKAIGARRRDILLQFLFESLVITLIGGVLGILSGLLITSLVSFGAKAAAGMNIDMSLSPMGLLLGLAVTSFFGIVFGFGPARRAASLQPIEAMRAD